MLTKLFVDKKSDDNVRKCIWEQKKIQKQSITCLFCFQKTNENRWVNMPHTVNIILFPFILFNSHPLSKCSLLTLLFFFSFSFKQWSVSATQKIKAKKKKIDENWNYGDKKGLLIAYCQWLKNSKNYISTKW